MKDVEKDKERRRKNNAVYREKNREKLRSLGRDYRRSLKKEVLEKYGEECSVCKFSDPRALQIDHIYDNGNVERALLGGKSFSGWRFYKWLKQNRWPEGYQTLCANCNLIKHLGDNF